MFSQAARRFLRDETATIMAEAVIVLPFMLWSYLALFVYWDAFRTENRVQKAAYTISDMISREMVTINDAYITGMDTLMEQMIDGDQDVMLRVTSLTYDGSVDDRYEVHWSRVTDSSLTRLTTTTLQDLTDHIPTLADGDYVMLVEAWVDYSPAFDVGLDDMEIRQFVVTRPRFVPKVCHASETCS